MPSQVKTGAILSYLGLGINVLIGLLYTPWMINTIGRDNYGLYTLAMSVISLFVFDFGLSSAVSRFVAKYIAEGHPEKANDCLGIVYRIYIILDVLILIVLSSVYFFIPQIYESLTPQEIDSFRVIYIIVSVFSLVSFPMIPLNGILIANEKFIQLKICELVNKVFIVITMSICLILGFGLYALVSVNVAAGLLMICLKLLFVKKYTSTRINFLYHNRLEQRSIIHFSTWVTIISLCQRMIFNIAPSILGIMSGAASIAILGIAITIEGYVYTFSSALSGLFLPKVSRIMLSGQLEILPLMIRVGRIQVMIIGAIILCFALFGQEFIYLWTGPYFSASYLCAIFLIIPAFIHLPQEIASTAISVGNKVKHQALVFICMALTNIALAFWFAKFWGATGIAFSICIAYLVRTIGMNIIYHKMLRIDIRNFFIKTYCKYILPAIIIISIGIFFNLLLNDWDWVTLVLKVFLLGISILLCYWFCYMTDSEKNIITSIIKWRKK